MCVYIYTCVRIYFFNGLHNIYIYLCVYVYARIHGYVCIYTHNTGGCTVDTVCSWCLTDFTVYCDPYMIGPFACLTGRADSPFDLNPDLRPF